MGYSKIRRYYEENRLLLALIIIVLVFVGGFIAINMSKVELNGDTLNITGLYGVNIPVSQITDVELKDSLPEHLNRTNGMDLLGMMYIGNFSSKELGKVKLFIHSNKKPYLYIALNNNNYKYLIITLDSGEETQALYERLKNNR